ncbi:uncharacterized protein TNCT_222751 [Trichonephila clavata]|uniref:Uncharacterized protein n=1 Tax=Trichonephila clavata TaxID=2740835 RepID=A0A8X6K7B9_TRICU|nr:uncharacterized protein TNCT_222751 [Trichonephila clavata]
MQEFFSKMQFPSQLSSLCSLVFLLSEFLFIFVSNLILSIFVIYYSLVCRTIRLLFDHLINHLRRQILIKELRYLLECYGEITKSMRNIDRDLSLPAFAAILLSMGGLFWTGYRLAFRKQWTNKYLVIQACTVSCYLTFQLLIMISASMTNEMEKKARNTIKGVKCRIPRDLRETKFKEVYTKENNLTLWKIYVLDRSLLITSFGTLLTYGILIGALGETNGN